MGKVTDFSSGAMTLGRLHHFGIASAALAPDHRDWLTRKVVPLLKRGGSVTIAGYASRSGSRSANKRLSKQRADAVRTYLEKQAQGCFKFLFAEGEKEGESAAKAAGQVDGTEDGNFRAVIVIAHVYPEPPKPTQVKPPCLVKRIVKQKIRFSAAKGPRDLGDRWARAAELINDVSRPENRVLSVEQKHIPVNHAVNRIIITLETKRYGVVKSTMYVVKFEWGPPKPEVEVLGSGHPKKLPRKEAEKWINKPATMLLRGF